VSKRVMGTIVPGSLRVQVTEYELVTVECGNCGHRQDTFPDSKMPWCRGCRRQMVLRHAAEVENVVPLRRRA
jgi:hypothetical protein